VHLQNENSSLETICGEKFEYSTAILREEGRGLIPCQLLLSTTTFWPALGSILCFSQCLTADHSLRLKRL